MVIFKKSIKDIRKHIYQLYPNKVEKILLSKEDEHKVITASVVMKNGLSHTFYFGISKKQLSEKQVDKIILKNSTCHTIFCGDCPYWLHNKDKINHCKIYALKDLICDRNKAYKYVIKKLKLRRIKEILQ